MRIARIAYAEEVHYALLDGESAELIADPFALMEHGQPVPLGRRVGLEQARLLAPVEPRTVVGMAHNTGARDRRQPPQAFLKPARSVIGPYDAIALPEDIGRVDAEAELAVVLAAPLAGHTAATVQQAVLGYTIANDVTARDLQRSDPLWTSAKGQHGFTPLGPWIETDLAAEESEVALSIDGERLRSASTAELARGIAEILGYLAGFLPLGPGDVVLTGAPGEVGAIRPGARVDAAVAGIGTLSNPVTGLDRPAPPVMSALGGHR